MTVHISDFAEWQITDTAEYIEQAFGIASKCEFRQCIRRTVRLLRKNPHLGPVEPLLADLPSGYRSIVVTPLNKMIYAIQDDSIEIVDLWDTRREPSSLVSEVRAATQEIND